MAYVKKTNETENIDLTNASAAVPNDTDLFPIIDAGVTKKITAVDVAAYISSAAGTGVIVAEVANVAALPAAADHTGELYFVGSPTGLVTAADRTEAGLYHSDGSDWNFCGYSNARVNDDEWLLYVNGSTTDYLKFDLSGLSAAVTITPPDGDLDLTDPEFNTLTLTGAASLAAGSAVAGTAPLKFTTGPLLETPEAGAMEFLDGRWYVTGTAKQRVIDRTGGATVTTTTVANSDVETTLWTESLSANAMKAGRIYKLFASGVASNAQNSDDLTLNIYFGGTKVATLTPSLSTYSNTPWSVEFNATIRTIGAGGTLAMHSKIYIGSTEYILSSTGNVDTTGANAVTIKAKWNNAKAGNTVSIYQGYLELKN